jgi:hypothetical protein
MVEALKRAGNHVQTLAIPGCNHFEASYHTGEPEGVWYRTATDFMARYRA